MNVSEEDEAENEQEEEKIFFKQYIIMMFVKLLGLKKEDFPTFRLIKIGENMQESIKYKPQSYSELTASFISQFIQDYFANKLKPDLMSQEIPDDWDAKPVKVLVGENFNQIVKDKSKTVLVDFCKLNMFIF